MANHPIDITVGGRIRAARIERGITQKDLARAASTSFQQIQKYESGANRISPSRLVAVSEALNMDATEFLKDLSTKTKAAPTSERSAVRLMKVYSGLDTAGRRIVLGVANAFAEAASH